MNREKAKELGFKEMPYFTVMNSLVLEIGRNRELSIGNLGTPNEFLFLSQVEQEPKKITDTVVIHNYDYDGYLTFEKLKGLVDLLMCKRLKESINLKEE